MPSMRRSTPTTPLRRLKTALSFSTLDSQARRSDSQSSISASASPKSASTTTSSVSPTQPFSGFKGFPGFAGFTHSNASTPALLSPDSFGTKDVRRVIRRKKSCVEIEQERERFEVDGALVGLVEPRPLDGPAKGGIEEVLFGKV